MKCVNLETWEIVYLRGLIDKAMKQETYTPDALTPWVKSVIESIRTRFNEAEDWRPDNALSDETLLDEEGVQNLRGEGLAGLPGGPCDYQP